MKVRGSWFFLTLLVGVGVGACVAVAAAGQRITVTSYGEMDPVVFDHTGHAEDLGCETCHHAKGSECAHRCGGCHRAEDGSGSLRLEEAAHKDGVGKCWGCHRGPKARKMLDCDDCHRS
ncbi:MAG: hypothetical protein IH608_06400 [Proteobacteria bacterium]|nr:hypothetical protein [Pseudomonadota bacterium]